MTELTVVIPTLNEVDNIRPILDRLAETLDGISYEVIFVDDDSTDGTADAIREISRQDPRVRVIQRIQRRGLSSACVEGMMASAAPYIAVMDADLQHDASILPKMLDCLRKEQLDIVVGSRNVEGGSMGNFAKSRVTLSNLGKRLSQKICRCPIEDPMSGYFVLTRAFLMEVVHRVSAVGFKILVDLLASSPRPVRIKEIPYVFGLRQHGESKLDIVVGLEYLQLLLDKTMGDLIPPTFFLFGAMGMIGVLIHLGLLRLLLAAGLAFGASQLIAASVAMTCNFLLNNAFTYRDRRLRGVRVLTGLLWFYVACSFGLMINYRIADFARAAGAAWYLAGLSGLTVGAIWNYAVTRLFTWRADRRVLERKVSTRAVRQAEEEAATLR